MSQQVGGYTSPKKTYEWAPLEAPLDMRQTFRSVLRTNRSGPNLETRRHIMKQLLTFRRSKGSSNGTKPSAKPKATPWRARRRPTI